MARWYVYSLAVLSLILGLAVPSRAQLRFAQPSVDLGEVRGGPVRSHRFACVNEGATPLEIVEIRRGCGCLVPAVERLTLAPGEAGVLAFQIRTLGQAAGPRPWRATVHWRQDGQDHETPLVLHATVVNEVAVEPAVLALYVGTSLRQEVRVVDTRTPPLRVVEAKANVPGLRVSLQPSTNGTTVVLAVAGTAVGPTPTTTTLDLVTDDPAYRHLQVPITVARAASQRVSAAPTSARLRLSAARPVGVALVRLRPHDGTGIVVAGVTPSSAGLSATTAAGPGDAATLRIQADLHRLDDRTGLYSVRVHLQEPAGIEIVVPVEIMFDE